MFNPHATELRQEVQMSAMSRADILRSHQKLQGSVIGA
jgi:hypothetical protein